MLSNYYNHTSPHAMSRVTAAHCLPQNLQAKALIHESDGFQKQCKLNEKGDGLLV
jgi:hypothetical protein